MSTGKTVQIIGAVVDVEFPRESIPQIYDALKIDDASLTLEVQQQLGDGIVRTIAMGSSETTSASRSSARILSVPVKSARPVSRSILADSSPISCSFIPSGTMRSRRKVRPFFMTATRVERPPVSPYLSPAGSSLRNPPSWDSLQRRVDLRGPAFRITRKFFASSTISVRPRKSRMLL